MTSFDLQWRITVTADYGDRITVTVHYIPNSRDMHPDYGDSALYTQFQRHASTTRLMQGFTILF